MCPIIQKYDIYKIKIAADQQQNYQTDLSFSDQKESKNQIFVNEFGSVITRKDLLDLSLTGWLNDES